MPAAKKKIAPKYFFLERYDLTPEEKESLAALTALPGFRVFEKYLARKQNLKAHSMITCDTPERMMELRHHINALAEITSDLALNWELANRKIGEDSTKKIK